MKNRLLHQEQTHMLLRMLPYALPFLIYNLSDNFSSYYGTLFLQLHGFSTQSIGNIGGAACILTIFAEMLFSWISDASRSAKRTAMLCIALTAGFILLVPISVNWKVGSFAVVFVVIAIHDGLATPAYTLMDNWVLRCSFREKYDYGIARSVGLVGSVAGSFLTTAVMVLLCRYMEQKKAAEMFYYIGFAMAVLAVMLMLPMHDAPAAETVSRKSLNPMRLLKNREYLALAVMYLFIALTSNPCNTFLAVAITENGLDGAKLGVVLGLQSIFQFPVLLTFARLKERCPLHLLVVIGTILCGVTSILRGIACSMWMLVVSSLFYGIANSLQITAAFRYIYELAPVELRGSGQAYYVAFGSFGSAIGVAAAGYAIAAWGVKSFYCRAGIATAVVGILYYLVTRMLQKASKQIESC